MDGTQIPTKIPCSSWPENHSETESRNESVAAVSSRSRARPSPLVVERS
jgi:hypothetical protein